MIYSYYPKTQFQANISVFGCAVTEKKTGIWDDVIVLKRDLRYFYLLYVKTNDIYGLLRQN